MEDGVDLIATQAVYDFAWTCDIALIEGEIGFLA